jgi:hypothetical protein
MSRILYAVLVISLLGCYQKQQQPEPISAWAVWASGLEGVYEAIIPSLYEDRSNTADLVQVVVRKEPDKTLSIEIFKRPYGYYYSPTYGRGPLRPEEPQYKYFEKTRSLVPASDTIRTLTYASLDSVGSTTPNFFFFDAKGSQLRIALSNSSFFRLPVTFRKVSKSDLHANFIYYEHPYSIPAYTSGNQQNRIFFLPFPSKATEYLWDFGDGTTSREERPIKAYNAQGFFNVTLTTRDKQGQTSTTQQDVKVHGEIMGKYIFWTKKKGVRIILFYERIFVPNMNIDEPRESAPSCVGMAEEHDKKDYRGILEPVGLRNIRYTLVYPGKPYEYHSVSLLFEPNTCKSYEIVIP